MLTSEYLLSYPAPARQATPLAGSNPRRFPCVDAPFALASGGFTPTTGEKTMADITPKEIFETKFNDKLNENPTLAKEVNAVILFDVSGPTGGQWTADLTKTSDWISAGAHAAPKMTVSVSDEDLVKIVNKQLNPQMAAMNQKLKFKPFDMGLAMKLGKLF
jgi:hypothetical protein